MNASPQSEWRTLVDMLRWQATHRPHEPAYGWWHEDPTIKDHITFLELDQRARALAAELQSRNLADERALLLFQPGFDYIAAFMGCLYAGVVAVPSYPLKRKRASDRVQTLTTDAQPAIVLTDIEKPIGLEHDVPSLSDVPWLRPTHIDQSQQNAWQPPDIDGESLAFLQYTSGSTADPKGVMLTHHNLLHNLSIVYLMSGFRAGDRGVVWLPPYHDMGLIGGLLQPLYVGGFVMLMSPFTFLQKPFQWLKAMSDLQAIITVAPSFAFDLCVDRITDEERDQLDLSQWQIAFVGSERVHRQTFDRFVGRFSSVGLRPDIFLPCYGLAESTLIVSCHPPQTPYKTISEFDNSVPYADLVGCGQPHMGTQIAIVDPQTKQELPAGETGEIWVHGSSNARGYWNKPQLSADTFNATLPDQPHKAFCRTGDLGFATQNDLFITGRIKELMIIRGRNYHPQDIERTVEAASPAIQPYAGAAFSLDVDGTEALGLVFELRRTHRHTDIDDLFELARSTIATEHGLDLYHVAFIRPGYMPRTSSGKVQRRKCRHMLLAGELPVIGERTRSLAKTSEQAPEATTRLVKPQTKAEMAALVQSKMAEVLEIDPTDIRLDLELADLGISSLSVVQLKEFFETALEIDLPLELFFELETVDELVDHLLATVR